MNALQNLFGRLGIVNFKAEFFVERHDNLQCVHRIQTHAIRAKERLLIADFLRGERSMRFSMSNCLVCNLSAVRFSMITGEYCVSGGG